MGSKKYRLDKTDLIRIARDALYIGVAAALTYIGADVLPNIDTDGVQNGTMIVAVAGVVLRFVQRWLTDNNDGKDR